MLMENFRWILDSRAGKIEREGKDLMSLKGVQFLSDKDGNQSSVLLDLRRHRRLWEDLYDAMLAESRRDEPRVAWADVKRRLRAKRK